VQSNVLSTVSMSLSLSSLTIAHPGGTPYSVLRYGYERVPGGGWRWANKLKESMMVQLSEYEMERLENWAIEGTQRKGGTRMKEMSYEDGILDVLGLLTEEHTVGDITGE
jgi:hypothetical protein